MEKDYESIAHAFQAMGFLATEEKPYEELTREAKKATNIGLYYGKSCIRLFMTFFVSLFK